MSGSARLTLLDQSGRALELLDTRATAISRDFDPKASRDTVLEIRTLSVAELLDWLENRLVAEALQNRA